MKILVDYDNTLVNFSEMFTAKYAELFPDKEVPRYTQLIDYDMSKTFGINWDIIQIIFNQIRRKNFYKGAAPMDACFFIWFKQLMEEGHELSIATKNPAFMKELIEYWLGKYGIYNIPIHFVTSMEDKLNMDFDLLIDDAPSFPNHKYWYDNPGKQLMVYDAPHNYQIRLMTNNQQRVYNWKMIYDGVQKLCQLTSQTSPAASD